MLLPVRVGLPPSAVFQHLNALMRELLLSSCSGRIVDQSGFPRGLWDAARFNEPTRARIQALRNIITALDANVRYELYLAFQGVASARPLFNDLMLAIPEPPEAVKDELKKLAVHLFERTSKLTNITQACGETIKDYYIRYSDNPSPGNGNVCGMCATELLAQRRNEVLADDQWRAPYDHLLAKDKYPQFGVDPGNLLPVCNTCNSKAKLAKDLLHDSAGLRRVCFDPWSESAHELVTLQVDFAVTDLIPKVTLNMISINPMFQCKLATWDEVYRIKERVEGEFLTLIEKLAEDLDTGDLNAFKQSIQDKIIRKMNYARLSPFNFWRSLLYSSLISFPDHLLEQLRTLTLDSLDPNGDAAATYGV